MLRDSRDCGKLVHGAAPVVYGTEDRDVGPTVGGASTSLHPFAPSLCGQVCAGVSLPNRSIADPCGIILHSGSSDLRQLQLVDR